MPDPPPPHMRIAFAKAVRDEADRILQAERSQFSEKHAPETRIPAMSHLLDAHGRRVRIGSVTVNHGPVSIDVDLGEAIPYIQERYGQHAVQMVPEIREQYLNSYKAEARAAYDAGKPLPPGATVMVGDPQTAYYPNRDVDGLAVIATMIRDGELDLAALLPGLRALEPPE